VVFAPSGAVCKVACVIGGAVTPDCGEVVGSLFLGVGGLFVGDAAGFEATLRVVGARFCGGCAMSGIAGPLAGAFGTFTSLL
jgi:hypothetical protein